MAFIPWIASALSILGLFLNARRHIYCWPVWLASNVLWIAHCVGVREWAAVVTWGLFLVFNAYGLYAWRKGAEEKG